MFLLNFFLVNEKFKDFVGLELGLDFGEENLLGFVDNEIILFGLGEVLF